MVTLVYELLCVFTIASGLLSSLSEILGLGEPGFLLLFFELALAGLFVIFKNSTTAGKLISVGILSSFTIFVLFLSRYESFIGKAIENIRLLWLLAFALAAFLIGELIAYVRVFGIVITAVTFISLIPFTLFKIDINKLFAASVFFLLLFTLTREIQLRWKKQGDTEIKTHMVFISPFIIITVLLVFLMPSSSKPYDWKIVKNFYRFVNETVQDIRIRISINHKEDYAETLMGFSDRGDINGNIKPNNDQVLAVIGIPKETDHLKLSGKNFSTFDGHEWTDEDSSEAPDSMFDTLGIMASLDEYSEHPEEYIRWEKLYIEYLQMNTSYVFAPEKSAVRKSSFPIYSYEIGYTGSDIVWPDTKSYKTSYRMVYLLVNTESTDFVSFLENVSKPSEKSYIKSLNQFGLAKDKSYSFDEFNKHQDYIHDFYCPDVTLSKELREYMDELLKDCDTDYEKITRICELLDSFEYTEIPGPIPDYVANESEFLDYFILKSQKGYCSYFATALTLLARAEGIPARYVQGYSTPTYSKTSMYITSSMAHAWTEVYFDNAGWISFDPTPGFEGGSYWKSSSKESYIPIFGNYGANEKPEEEKVTLPELPEFEEEVEENSISVKWYMIVIPLISGIGLIALFLSIFKLISKKRFEKLDYGKQFIILSRQIFLILKYLGHPIFEYETIDEYQKRLKKDYSDENLVFMSNLEEYLYGSDKDPELFKDACKKTTNIRRGLLDKLKHKNFLKYLRYQIQNF